MRRPSFALIAFAIALAAGGCGPGPMIQVETTIRPDGSCERSTWQPRGRLLPAGAFTPEWVARWGTIEDVTTPPAFAETDSAPGEGYFHARGVFASPADVPAHYRKIIDDRPELGERGMTHEYRRRDFGPFVEHRWAETLANGVTREGFDRAREEFLDLAMPMLTEGVERVYGRDFDVDAAVEELGRRGRPLFRDVLDAWYDGVAAGGKDPRSMDEVMKRTLVAAIERAGLDLRDASGEIVDGPEGERRVREHVAGRVAATFRRKDGSPPTPDDVAAILGGPHDPSFADAWRRYIEDRKPEIEAKLVPPLARMTGPYFFPGFLAPPAPRFAFDVHLPGRVVKGETNGDVDAAGKVSWRFDAARLFPTAFTMTAVGIEVDEAAQRRLLGRVAIPGVESALAVRDLLADDPELAETLRRACESGDAPALGETPAMDAARKMRLARLRGMLGMAP
ncbi:MAG: hypothetical protein BGO49_15155 [Planctomycetales bacterium 71-10]|nr:MAG: hypothetical protein BGO49_15155 [Planctomycetales bacterium 71-10]